MDIDVLKDSYKPRVLLLISLLSFPIVSILTLVIHRLTKKLLTKHWMPKSKRVSNNNKKILIKSNSKKSKIIGGGILALSSLFVSSYVVSGMNVLTMPLKRKNPFSKGTDALANIYSAGLASNSDIPFYIDNFIKNADNETRQGLSSLINFVNLEDEISINKELEKSDVLKTRESLFEELFKSSKASSEIIRSILSYEKIFINPLLWDKETYEKSPDKYGNSQGYNNMKIKKGENRKMFIEDLEKYFKENPFKYKLPQSIQNVYAEILRDFLSDWDKTKFAQNILSIKAYARENETTLDNQKSLYQESKNKKTRLIESRDQKINNISSNMSEPWIEANLIKKGIKYKNVKSNSFSDWDKFEWSPSLQNNTKNYFMDKKPEIKDTKLQKEYDIFNKYKKEFNDKRKEADEAEEKRLEKEKNFITAPNHFNYQAANNKLANLENIMKNDLNSWNYWKNEYDNRIERLKFVNQKYKETKFQLSSKNSILDEYSNNFVNENKALLDLKEDVKNSKQEYQAALDDYSIENVKHEKAENNYKEENKKFGITKLLIDDKSSEIMKLNNYLSDKEKILANLRKNNPKYSQINKEISDLSKDIQDINYRLSSLQKQYNDQQEKLKEKKHQLDKIKDELKKAYKEKEDKLIYYSQLENHEKQLNSKVDNIKTSIKEIKNEINSLSQALKKYDVERTVLNAGSKNFESIAEANYNIKQKSQDYQISQQSFNDFKKIYDHENSEYQKLSKAKEEKENISSQAEIKKNNQKIKISQMVESIKYNLEEVEKLNEQIKNKSEEIARYDNIEILNKYNEQGKDYQSLFDLNNKNSDLLVGISENANQSILYFDAKDKAMKERIVAAESIASNIRKTFDKMINKIIDIYKKWING